MTHDPAHFVERDADSVEREKLFDRLDRLQARWDNAPGGSAEEKAAREEIVKLQGELRKLRGLSFEEKLEEPRAAGKKGLLRRRAKPSGGKAKA